MAFESNVTTELKLVHGDWRSDAYKEHLEFSLEKKVMVPEKWEMKFVPKIENYWVYNYFYITDQRIKKFVIISDSITKYVLLENAEVVVLRGANIGEIGYKLDRNKKMFEKYMNFIVHVGTNDAQKLSNDQFKSAYCNLITRVKTLFPSAVIGISSILPRPVDF